MFKDAKALVQALCEEVLDKHLIDIFEDKYLNPDYHLEVTITVKELKLAAKELGITEIK